MKRIVWLLVLVFCMQTAIAESAPADGLYTIGVSSNAKMFKITDCILRVEDGNMTAVLTMSGSGYGYLYQGTSAQADAAPREDWTPCFANADGKHRFAIEIPYLDGEMPMASWSIRYEKWYDRTLQFFSNTLSPYREIVPDGVYSAEICSDTIMDGKSCLIYSRDGVMTLKLALEEDISLQVDGQKAEYDDGFASAVLSSLDLRVPLSFDSEEGWLKVDSCGIQTYAVKAEDGVYRVKTKTDSGLLRFTDCGLVVENGEMIALLTSQNNNFEYLYLGLASDANANPDQWIPAVPNAEGVYTYKIPIASLDNTIQIATYSAKKRIWYDRELTLDSQTLIEQE